MKEKFIIVRYLYHGGEDNHLNQQGECSIVFMIKRNGKFEFDSEIEATRALKEELEERRANLRLDYLNARESGNNPPTFVFEIRKIYKID